MTRRTKPSPTEKCSKQLGWEGPNSTPNFKLETPRLQSGAAPDRPEIIEIPQLPPIPEVVWQQPTETITDQVNLNKTSLDSILHYTQENTTVANQMSPSKGTQPQNYVVTTKHPPGNQTGNEPVQFPNCSKKCSTDIQNSEQHVTTTFIGDTTAPPLTTATPLIEEGLVRDEQTNQVYLPLTSTVVLKLEEEKLYVPPDFKNIQKVDALVHSRAFVSAIAQNALDTIKEKAPKVFLKIQDPPEFQIQVANGQLGKPISTATLKFEIGDTFFHWTLLRKEEFNKAINWVAFYEE